MASRNGRRPPLGEAAGLRGWGRGMGHRFPPPAFRLPVPRFPLPSPVSPLPTPDSRFPLPHSRLSTSHSRLPAPDSRPPLRRVPDAHRRVEQVEQALGGGHRLLEHARLVGEGAEGPVEVADIGEERGQNAQRDRRLAAHEGETAGEQNERDRHGLRDLEDGPVDAEPTDLLEVGVPQGRAAFAEPRVRPGLPVEQLDRRHSGELFLQQRVEGRRAFADAPVGPAQPPVRPEERGEERRHRGEDERGEARVDDEHEADHAGDQEQVRDRADDALGDEALDRLDVGRDARHEPAHRRAVVEREVEGVGLAEDIRAEVVDDALADPRRQEALAEPHGEGDGGEAQVEEAVAREPGDPPGRGNVRRHDPRVDRVLDQHGEVVQRERHPEQQGERGRHPARVRAHVAQDAHQEPARRDGGQGVRKVVRHDGPSSSASSSCMRTRSR